MPKQLRYPSELANTENSDYLSFGFYKYYPAYRKEGALSGNRGGLESINQTNSTNTTENAATRSYFAGKTKAEKLNTPDGNFGRKMGEDILLYMPPDISTSFAADWGGKEVNNATAGGLAAASNILSGDVKGLADNVMSGFTSLGALPQSTAARITKSIAQAAGSNLNMNDVLAGTTGTMLNPNVEVLFGGPKLRNVSFAFKMSARNRDEAEDIHKICTIFKKNLLPGYGASARILDSALAGLIADSGVVDKTGLMGKYGNFIEVPNLVMLKYMKGSKMHPYLSQYKSLALTNVDVNYTPDGVYSTFVDGFPTAVELRISLVETKLVYKSEVEIREQGKAGTRNWSY